MIKQQLYQRQFVSIRQVNLIVIRMGFLYLLLWLTSIVGADTYLSPIDVCAKPDGSTVYVAQLTAGKVAVFDTASESVRQDIVLPTPNQASGLTISPDAARLYITVSDANGKVYVVSTASNTVIDTISVGHTPVSPVVSPDGTTLFVCNRFDNSISMVDLTTKKEVVIPVIREPVSAAVTPDGSMLIVSNFLPAGATTDRIISSAISLINTSSKTVTATIPLPNGSTSARGVCVSGDGHYAYIVHLLAKYYLPPNQVERGWIYNNALSIIDLDTHVLRNTVLLDDLDRGAANPWGVKCSDDSKYLIITHSGTHEISVIDRNQLHVSIEDRSVQDSAKDFSILVSCRRRIRLKGKSPRGFALVGTRAYIAEYFTGSLGICSIDPLTRPRPRSVSLGAEGTLTPARRGELIYNDASFCFQNWLSCASCHPDARSDALNWDELNDGFGNAKNTKSHLYTHFTPPTTITGCRPNAETSVRAGLKFTYFTILPESDAIAVDEYLKNLQPVSSPFLVNGKLSQAAIRGKQLFDDSAGCAACHTPSTYFTNMKLYDVGTGTGRHQNSAFDTPTLAEVWRTAPYLYLGQAATIKDVLTVYNKNDKHGNTSHLSDQEINDLTEYVLSIGSKQ